MGDIKLFRIQEDTVSELDGRSIALEKSLQGLVERHLEELLGIRFLATEYSTGKKHGGRIDTLGIDENRCPIIIEYKRARNENVINQGLYYLDWLMDHKAEFELLVMKELGREASEGIEWTGPRLLCIAGAFTKFDEHAVGQINRNIELIRYRSYPEGLLLLELVNAAQAAATYDSPTMKEDAAIPLLPTSHEPNIKPTLTIYKRIEQYLDEAPEQLKDMYESVKQTILSLGDDVQFKPLKMYFAFKRIKNIACVELRIKERHVIVFLSIDPSNVELEEGFTRDMTNIGHFGTGNLEIRIKNQNDINKAIPLFERAYEEN